MKAWQLLSSPARFCKGVIALDKQGRAVDACSLAACRWCFAGALLRCYPVGLSITGIAHRLRMEIGNDIGAWSDNHGWRAVHRLLKRLNI